MTTKHARAGWNESPMTTLRAGEGFRLADLHPRSKPGFDGDREVGEMQLATGLGALGELQERLFAESYVGNKTDAVLLVLQAMDSAGKGGIVRHVVGGVDPQGVKIRGFKKPTAEELEHDFLWRIERELPEPGIIGVFDRSHYEDVLVARVRNLASAEEIERRYGAINDFERRVVESGTRIVKVMLHISYDEQGERLMERLDRPDKHWKYNPGDVDDRKLWPAFQDAYQTVFERTSTDIAPWYVVPADRKWFARLAVQELLLQTLTAINPGWPAAEFDVATEKQRLGATMSAQAS